MTIYKLELVLLFGRNYDNVAKTFVIKFRCVDVLNKIAHASGESHLLIKIGFFSIKFLSEYWNKAS